MRHGYDETTCWRTADGRTKREVAYYARTSRSVFAAILLPRVWKVQSIAEHEEDPFGENVCLENTTATQAFRGTREDTD